jgi:hypothetical protein
MVRIDSQEQLKTDLQSLQEKGFVQSNGPLERRGVEVDHTFYLPKENMTMTAGSLPADEEPSAPVVAPIPVTSPRVSTSTVSAGSASPTIAPGLLQALQLQLGELNSQMATLQSTMQELQQRMDRLERDLGM